MNALEFGDAAGNAVTAAGLAIAGLLSLAMAGSASQRNAPLPRPLAVLAAVGLIALAADELFDLHEHFSRWLWDEHGIGPPAPFHHFDDVIIVGYGAVLLAALAMAAPRLVAHRRFLVGTAACGVLMAVAVATDVLATPGSLFAAPEEACEALAPVLLSSVFALEPSVQQGLRGIFGRGNVDDDLREQRVAS